MFYIEKSPINPIATPTRSPKSQKSVPLRRRPFFNTLDKPPTTVVDGGTCKSAPQSNNQEKSPRKPTATPTRSPKPKESAPVTRILFLNTLDQPTTPKTRKSFNPTPKLSKPSQHLHSNPETPKRKRADHSPEQENPPKTPRIMPIMNEKIRQPTQESIPQPTPSPLPPPTTKLKTLKKKNPHPCYKQQEFVKVANSFVLLKHNGLAISSRKSLKQKKKIPQQATSILDPAPKTPLAKIRPPRNTPSRCSNFGQLVKLFSSQNLPSSKSLNPGKNEDTTTTKSEHLNASKVNKISKKNRENPELPRGTMNKNTSSNETFIQKKISSNYNSPPTSHPHLPLGPKFGKNTARPAPNSDAAAAQSSAVNTDFQNLKIGGKNPPVPFHQ